jgi:hypothetical protein
VGRAGQFAIADRMATNPANFAFHTGDMIYDAATKEWNPKFFVPYASFFAGWSSGRASGITT